MTPDAPAIRFVKSVLFGLGCAVALCQTASAAPSLASLPLYFEANQGQADTAARFIARGQESQFLISPDEARLVLFKAEATASTSARSVRMQFIGANARARISGAEELPGKINYLIGGDASRWKTGVATFAKVHVEDVYPGVGLTYYGNHRRLEYDFSIAPGAKPEVIAIHFDGADKMSVNPAGELVLNLGSGEIRQLKPVIWQTVQGARREVAGGYKMLDSNTVGFSVGEYDHGLPLVIDPVLSYSTYFGGNGNDTAWAVAVDTNGFVYVAGQTTSTQFAPGRPFATPGAIQTNYQGGSVAGDAFVAKFDNLGTNLIYLTYIGGSADDAADAMAVDASGQAYVAGWTDSSDFPTTTNAPDRSIGGTSTPPIGYPIDAFVAKLNAGGSNLVFSTYLGGAAADDATAIALDASNNVYVTGFTFSTNFQWTANAFQKESGVTNWTYQAYYNANAFVAEIAACGTNLLYSSYLGGTNYDIGEGIALDNANNIYVAGFTASVNFPNTNSFQESLNGATNATPASDAFVARFSPGFSNLVYSTFLGGTNDDRASHLAVDGSGNAYVTGWTVSTNFPNTVTNQTVLHNDLTNNTVFGFRVTTNAFLTQITWNGTNAAIGYSTVFGGTNVGIDIGYGVAVDPAGNVFVCGASSSQGFPALNSAGDFAATNSGGFDAFVIAFATNASSVLYSGCLGGAADDFGYGVAVDPAGNAYVAGGTSSANFPTNSARQTALDGTTDAFLAKIVLANEPPLLSMSADGGNVQVAWDSSLPFEPELPRLFKLESSTNLVTTNWMVLPQLPVLSGNRYAVTVNPTNSAQFFRLRAAQP
jgi:hypothetical protein